MMGHNIRFNGVIWKMISFTPFYLKHCIQQAAIKKGLKTDANGKVSVHTAHLVCSEPFW